MYVDGTLERRWETVHGSAWMRRTRHGLSQAVTWTGVGVVGVLAVPAGLLFLLISGVWRATDRITARLEGERRD